VSAQGHPDYRYFSATLAPVTGLTPGQQAEYFPKAAAHAAAASSEASSALGATDDPSLVTWALKYRWVKSIGHEVNFRISL
jgi:hypothetical protein